MSKTVSLPNLPKDDEFEDYVASFIQASGYYIEKSIIDRDEAEVLELDIIFTNYKKNAPPFEKLIEVKSGGWGFPDIFKILGWGNYLKISDLYLVVCKEKSNQTFYKNKGKDIGVNVISHSNNEDEIAKSELLNGISVDLIDVNIWRFSYWLERKILQKIKAKKKSIQDKRSFAVLDHYYHELNSRIFFSKNIIKRVDDLYALYKEYPNLSKRVSNELNGEEFFSDHERIPIEIFKKTFYNHEFTDLVLSTYIEHRSRLAILKAAVDFSLFELHGIDERVKEEINILGLQFSLKDLLPTNFLIALSKIKKEPYFHLYPLFWQYFLWFFGGFILLDYKDEEYKLLSLKTGIPVDEIDNALSSYGKLFPFNDSWFRHGDSNSNITTMKMMCTPFMGVGANFRRFIYTDDQKFSNLKLTGNYTRSNLISWNNLIVDILS